MSRKMIAVVIVVAAFLSVLAAWIIADDELAAVSLPTVSEEESGITVKNSYASDITRSQATLNLKITKTFVTKYILYIGTSEDDLKEYKSVQVGKNITSAQITVDGLSEYTRYYYRFHLILTDKEVVLNSWSFITPNSYFNGASGGKNDENVTYGVDVSFWCKSSDFEKAKADGIDFVIIRAGSTGNKDPYFEENYEKAKAAGLKVGAYYYTYAMSVEEAEADAEEYLSFICGKQFDMPVYCDIENIKQQSISRQELTEMMLSFCEKIAASGYYAGVYANRNWFNTLLNYDTLAPVYELWIAQWTSDGEPSGDYSDKYGVWQYYDKGSVDGVQGNADLNVCYKDYSSIINNEGTVPYDFVDWDGTVICTYYMYPGSRIYTPAKQPEKASDDAFSYEFDGWDGLDENTVASDSGGSFSAVYKSTAHNYSDWEEVWLMERKRTCADCGYVQNEILGDLTCGENTTWYYSDGTLKISGSGSIKNGSSASDFGWNVITDEITSIEIEEGITEIGDYAFSELGSLTSVKLPMTLSSIGNHAFENDSALTVVTIPAAAENAAESAFDGCTALRTVKGYETGFGTAEKIAENSGASYITAKKVLAYYKRYSGINWYIYTDGTLIVSGIGKVGDSVADDLDSYSSIIISAEIGAGITELPDEILAGAKILKSVKFLGETPVTVGKYAFSDCAMLTELDIPRGSKYGQGAFTGTPIIE